MYRKDRRMRLSALLLNTLLFNQLVLVAASSNPASHVTTSSSGHMITADHVEYHLGSPHTNIIMTAPHDGHIKPSSIPHRQKGCYNSTNESCDWNHECNHAVGDNPRKCRIVDWPDLRASDLAIAMRNTISEITGHAPHLIISRLHRSKLDPNRERDNAAQHNEEAERSYDTFHGFIQQAHNQVQASGNPGVHFDIHGYTMHNTDNWLELGYNLQSNQLNEGDLNPANSSIRELAARSSASFESIIAGENSLGWLVQQEGFRVVPSPQYPRPDMGVEGKYYRGGILPEGGGHCTEVISIVFSWRCPSGSEMIVRCMGKCWEEHLQNGFRITILRAGIELCQVVLYLIGETPN